MIPAGDINVARDRGSIEHVQRVCGEISSIGLEDESIDRIIRRELFRLLRRKRVIRS